MGTTCCTGRRKSPLGILGVRRGGESKSSHIWSLLSACRLTRTLTVLTGDSPVAGATHTCSRLSLAGVAVGAVLETGLVAVAPPQAVRAGLAAAGTFKGGKAGGA